MAAAASVLLFLPLMATIFLVTSEMAEVEVVASAREAVELAKRQILASSSSSMGQLSSDRSHDRGGEEVALVDCLQLYGDSEYRLRRLTGNDEPSDAMTWISAALTSHRMCMDGMVERNVSVSPELAANVTRLLSMALAAYAYRKNNYKSLMSPESQRNSTSGGGFEQLLASWHPTTRIADMVVAKDGSGDYQSINEALAALARQGWRGRRVIYVKAGVYVENVEIRREMRDLMFIGDGIDKTVVTGHRSVPEGYSTFRSATFGVAGDGFWARDMTFENTAGPEKHQAVALRVGSDRSVFYRCSFRGYQDTLFVVIGRQFYRECDVYGTVDFIFGNAAAVLQNCNIYPRKPMSDQSNMITAQGRDDPNDNTGISIQNSRVLPAGDLEQVKTFLGRPWKKYSRTVFMGTDMDGLVNPRGWAPWRGGFALNTLYYGEYMNKGVGADTRNRVDWPGFHVLTRPGEAQPFTVESFIQGQSWLPETGVPFSPGL